MSSNVIANEAEGEIEIDLIEGSAGSKRHGRSGHRGSTPGCVPDCASETEFVFVLHMFASTLTHNANEVSSGVGVKNLAHHSGPTTETVLSVSHVISGGR